MTPPVTTAAPQVTEQALHLLEEASTEHLEWLKEIHCSLLFQGDERRQACRSRAVEDGLAALVPDAPGDKHAAFKCFRDARQRMEEIAADLTKKAALGERLHQERYLAFMAAVETYNSEGRRLELMLHQALAETDPLTGLLNRRGMMRDLRREWVRATRNNDPCCIALVDLDHFKEINDIHGHVVGDQMLAAAARFFLRRLRPYDLVYRFGGEEFLFCLPHADLPRARRILERLRVLMPRQQWRSPDRRRIPVTMSMGLAALAPKLPPEASIARADYALYAAKTGGRNRICIAEDDDTEPEPVTGLGVGENPRPRAERLAR